MLSVANGSERTVIQFKKLFEKSGWKLVRCHLGNASGPQDMKVIGVPA